MEDVDSFLASLEQFTAPSLTDSASAYRSHGLTPSQRSPATTVQPVSDAEVNRRAASTASLRKRKRRRSDGEGAVVVHNGSGREPPDTAGEGVPSTSLPPLSSGLPPNGLPPHGCGLQDPLQEPSLWPCPRCTLLNSPHATLCDACLLPRPSSSESDSSNARSATALARCDAPLPTAAFPPSATPSPTGVSHRNHSLGSGVATVPPEETLYGRGGHGGADRTGGSSFSSSDGDSSDDSDTTDCSSTDSSGDDDGDAGRGRKDEGEGGDPLDNRGLVMFLQTLEAVPYDKLPCAPMPPTMRVRGQLRPFQLQALQWLRSREEGTSALEGGERRRRRRRHSDGRGATNVSVGDTSSDEGSDNGEGRCTAGSSDGYHDHRRPPGAPGEVSARTESLHSVRGGIFADDMGLGKTRTMIALCESTSAVRRRLWRAAQVRSGDQRGAVSGHRPHAKGQWRADFKGSQVERITGSQVVSEATLVVCPTALLHQWAAEIYNCIDAAPSSSSSSPTLGKPIGVAPAPRVLLYHGSRKKRLSMFDIAEQYDYVLTSYQTLVRENMPHGARGGGGGGGERPGSGMSLTPVRADHRGVDGTAPSSPHYFSVRATMAEAPPGKLFMIHWKRVILDEAHTIRNVRSKVSRVCMRLTARHRWAVTATPVQNNLNDLFPLLKFLGVPHFGSVQWWNSEIVGYFVRDPNHQRPVTALRILFGSLLLRRTPDSVVHGAKILELPSKEIKTEYIVLSREEQAFYDAVHASATKKIDAAAQRQREAAASNTAIRSASRWGTVDNNNNNNDNNNGGSGVVSPVPAVVVASGPHRVNQLTTFSTAFEMLMRCRQTCLHPYIVVAALRRFRRRMNSGDGHDGEGRHHHNGANASATAAASATPDVARLWEKPATAATAAAAGRHGFEKREEEEQRRTTAAIDAYVDRVLKRVIAVKKGAEFLHELVDELRRQKLEDRECTICLDSLLRPAILPCGHTFCEDCITHALQVKRQCPMCKRSVHPSKVLVVPVELLRKESAESEVTSTETAITGGDDTASGGAVDVVAAAATRDLSSFDAWELELSTKTRFLLGALRSIPADEKVVVFSSFTTYLDYARHCLDAGGIPNITYTGALSLKQKDDVLRRFAGEDVGDNAKRGGTGSATTASPAASPRVLLASITACGVGLNLVSANHCFLMDPTWNPGVEDQALHRIHRIGQTKPVTVVRLIARGTVEEKIELLSQHKRQLSGYCFAGGGGGGGRLRVEELMELFITRDATGTDGGAETDDSDS